MERSALTDDAVVLRAGLMKFEDLRRNALITLNDPGFGVLGISVRAGTDVTDLNLMTTPYALEHSQMRRTTAARLRSAGFAIEPTGEPHHCTIRLPDIENRTLESLVSAFDALEPNPASQSFSR
jgi:hypothetical protein